MAGLFCRPEYVQALAGPKLVPKLRDRGQRFLFPVTLKTEAAPASRLDKWLWAVRVFKTRSLATDACRAGSVQINSQPAKPAREVRLGEQVVVRQGLVTRTFQIVGVPPSRVGAKLVRDYCADLTPAEEFEKAKAQPLQQLLAREKGSGRPTKRDRRMLDQLFRS